MYNVYDNEYTKNHKTNFTLSAKMTKINLMWNEEMGGKCENLAGHQA